jgi:hypothetical protein
MRVFFYYPTWNKPSGGNKQLRLMATLLSQLGVETFLVRDRKFFAPGAGFDDDVFYNVPVPLAPFVFEEAGEHLGCDDVLILPEVLLESSLPVCSSWRCRIALNNQNGFSALRYRPAGRRWADRLEFSIANAPYVASICRKFLGIPAQRIFQVPHWVVRPPFSLIESDGLKELAICYMPRKLPEEVRRVRDLVQSSHPDVPWVEIDGLNAEQVAQKLRENAIFFAAHDEEGCPLPGLEAMACGCLVAGFTGTAGFPHPYANGSNGFWSADRNVPAAADALRRVIDLVRSNGAAYCDHLAAGRQTVQRFAEEPVRKMLCELVEVVRNRSYSSRRQTIPGLGWRGNLDAYRLLYDSDQLGWPGRLLGTISQATKPIRTTLGLARG